MSITQVFGWHGLPPSYRDDGEMDWVHVPDETYENQYPRTYIAHVGTVEAPPGDGKAYVGLVHHNVDILEAHLITTLNHNVIMESKAQHLVCRDCGAES